MGANSSKQADSVPPHVWKGSSPPASVSQDMLEALQSSSETDASRAQLLESQIQGRVATELRRLQADEDARIAALTAKLAAAEADGSDQQQQQQTGAAAAPSRHQVSKEIQQLREKLETRRLIKEVPASVEAARSDVVRCLREHDRRPLDCWREVEAFKEEVRRLEKGWVERIIS